MSIQDLKSYRQRIDGVNRERTALVADRDEMIREDHQLGVTIAALSRATGLTRTMLYKIINKEGP